MGIIYKNNKQYGGNSDPGHIIIDTDDRPMVQEESLQFKGLKVSDNSADSQTEIESFGLTQQDLDELSVEGIKNTFVQSPFIYSTEEQIVGKWVDGKIIYQKTFIFNTGSSASTSYNTGLTGIDKVVDTRGFVIQDPWDASVAYLPVGFNTNAIWFSAFGTKQGTIEVRMSSGYYNKQAYITLQYTKTS